VQWEHIGQWDDRPAANRGRMAADPRTRRSSKAGNGTVTYTCRLDATCSVCYRVNASVCESSSAQIGLTLGHSLTLSALTLSIVLQVRRVADKFVLDRHGSYFVWSTTVSAIYSALKNGVPLLCVWRAGSLTCMPRAEARAHGGCTGARRQLSVS